ncbi:Src substrate cortactin [Gryllus bimaculatus]|nr:Src substrate cortactin [Gryllus bimaculatus]
MWKAAVGTKVEVSNGNDDDWETDPDFVNDVTEQEQRWGSRTVEGSGRTAGAIDMKKLREETTNADAILKQKLLETGPNPSYGYGGKFGVQTDRAVFCDFITTEIMNLKTCIEDQEHRGKYTGTETMMLLKDYSTGFGGKFGVQSDRVDKSAEGWEYKEKIEKHASQKDYATGFGGKFGVQKDRQDKSAVGWDHVEKVEKHESQKDYAKGFGGKFGVQTDRQDKSAVGWDHVEKIEKHASQKDYAVGFGGKFGVQEDRQDKSAVGWDHHERLHQHESQTDQKQVGFGGKFGIQSDRVDKSAHDFSEQSEKVGTNYEKPKPDIGSVKPSNLRAKFENLAKQGEEEAKKRAEEERERRRRQEQIEAEEARKQELRRLQQLQQQEQPQQDEESIPEVPVVPETNTALQPQPAARISVHLETEEMEEIEQAATNLLAQSPTTAETQLIHTQATPAPSSISVPASAPSVQQSQEPELEVDREPSAAELEVYRELEQQAAADLEEDDTGYTAVALYDYQAAAEDEISFDPDDVITNVEMVSGC